MNMFWIGLVVRAKDGDRRFTRGEVVGLGTTPSVVIVKWPHETAYACLRDLEVCE